MTRCMNQTCLSPSTNVAPEIFSSALQFFAAAQCLIAPSPLPEADFRDCEEYDFIIIGAGTAGCVIANRLTENKNIRVLLIEAGDDGPVESRIPALDKAVFRTKYDWQYFTSNDGRINQASNNGSIMWPRGKMVGGSSNINGMLYIKGRRHDYEQWYNAGNKHWHPDIVDFYFKKAESFQNQNLLKYYQVDMEYGHDGKLVINRFNSTIRDELLKIVDSWDDLGINKVVDLNLPGKFRSGVSSVTAANGLRQSSDIAYIYPVLHRPNLKILKNTFVRKILINNLNKAYGVEAEREGKIFTIYASLEVILSAGSINSPQLLMLSGIGPKQHLNSRNIFCKVNSPLVGRNLQDHFTIPITIYGNGPSEISAADRNFDAIKYLYNRTGYLAQNSFTDILAFYSTSKNMSITEYQNHVIIYWKNSSKVYNVFSTNYRYQEPIPSYVAELNKNHVLFLFAFSLLHPYSRGTINLKTNNPRDHPLIYPNYFLNPKDLDSAVRGIKIITKIIETKYFKSINAFLGRLTWPECDQFELDSDDYWRCICINMVQTIYHPVGTCKMGPDANTSVVDTTLKVHGVQNLRVIDASIMPTITSGNTNAPTTMIAERGVDLVKRHYNL